MQSPTQPLGLASSFSHRTNTDPKRATRVSRFQIPMSDYNRIYQVAHGVTQTFGGSEKGCIFFACFGSMMLNKHYKIPARVVAGGFALCINDKPEVAFFGEIQGNRVATSADAFHMWVQTETHIIDFMAPIFPEAFASQSQAVPRKMLQRPFASEAADLNTLTSPGDFFTLPDPDLTESLVDNFLGRVSSSDLLSVAEAWFGNPRRPQKRSVQMADSTGETYNLSHPATTAIGSW
jgi:hypothetical protein